MIGNYAHAIWGIGKVLYEDLEKQKAANKTT